MVYPSPDIDLEQPQEQLIYIPIHRVIKISFTAFLTAESEGHCAPYSNNFQGAGYVRLQSEFILIKLEQSRESLNKTR